MTNPTNIERTFNISGPARLTLRNVSGEIVIEGGKRATIEVTAVKHPGRGFDQTEIEMEQAADGAVRVATRFEGDLISRLLGGGEPCRVDYTVRVPRDTSVELAYVSGPAEVLVVHGALDLQSVAGPLTVTKVSGTLRLRTVSGPVNAAEVNLDQPLRVETVSGPVTVTDSYVPGARAQTTSGNLLIESSAASGPYQISTVSGAVDLYLPAETQGTVQVSSLSGRLHNQLPGIRHGAGPADAGVMVRISSVSGDVTLSAAPNAVDEPPPTPAADDRMALLDRVARGELSVDEALKNLNT